MSTFHKIVFEMYTRHMNIKKLGHCCLLIKTNNVTVLTDPGTYSTVQDEIKGIDVVLITHEHQDHFHIDSVKKVLVNNPNAKIITNNAVGKLLAVENIAFEIVTNGLKNDLHGVLVEGYGEKHAEIYKEFGQVENTGYFVDNKLFYPGDAFTVPNKPVDILAVPIAGPWMKASIAIDYALEVKPRIVFPVHDGIMKTKGFMQPLFNKILSENGVEFVGMVEGDEKEF